MEGGEAVGGAVGVGAEVKQVLVVLEGVLDLPPGDVDERRVRPPDGELLAGERQALPLGRGRRAEGDGEQHDLSQHFHCPKVME